MKRMLPITLIALCFCILPAAAVILEVTVSGTVSAFDQTDTTLTIAEPARYGCSYPAGGTPVCSYTPLAGTPLTGTVPDASAFSVFSPGDPVVATSLGGAGGNWITLAKLTGTDPDKTVTDIVGDPSTIAVPLAGDYSLELTPIPDCTACSGTTCTASAVNVSVLSGGMPVAWGDLRPNATTTYSGRNDGSSITVAFIKGQASSASCSDSEIMMTGPQAISVYIVRVVPPVGSGLQPAETASATPAEVTMPADALSTTAKAGMLPLAAIGALALAAILGACRRG